MSVGTVVLVVAVALNAVMAGVYFSFTTAVMPGLARTSDRAYVTSMQRVNESIMNPWFLGTFVGALVAPIVAAVLVPERAALPWVITGAAAYGATVVITGMVNVPLNNQLMAAGDVTDHSASAVRTAFHRRWTRFNAARTALSLVAVVALAIAVSRTGG